MSNARHLLYVGDVAPGPGQGGRIVLDRHLRRLAADGWKITVVTSSPECAAGPWALVRMPARRPWWPPFRAARPWLSRLRSCAWARELRGVPPFDAILTLCWGPLAWLAAHLAETKRRPLLAILHDHWSEGGSAEDALIGARACRAARVVLTVSEEMRLRVDADFGAGKAIVLPPLPASRILPFATWREEHAAVPVLAHVGALHPYHAGFLERAARALAALHGRLLLLCPGDNPVLAQLRGRIPNLEHQPFFPSNEEALRFIAGRASGLVVMYSHGRDKDPTPTGFPSRFIEFSQLGLPILLAAPERNPVRAWARRHDWPAQFDPDDDSALRAGCAGLADRDTWERFAAASSAAALGEFDSEHIHRLLAARLQVAFES